MVKATLLFLNRELHEALVPDTAVWLAIAGHRMELVSPTDTKFRSGQHVFPLSSIIDGVQEAADAVRRGVPDTWPRWDPTRPAEAATLEARV